MSTGISISPFIIRIKYFFDFIFAVMASIVFSPLIIIIAIAIKIEDPKGDIIFRQKRVGYRGKEFLLVKFRSMKMDAEKNNKPMLYHENDDRLTKVGKFIREHHLDEFPQLWNVIKGDMAFVGPRPERQYYIDKIMEKNEDYKELFKIRPGLFSYATLYNGYTDTIEKMLKRLDYDLEYMRNYSIFTDIKIITLTTLSIIFGRKF